jgi:two-component system, LuxR family, sensor kinase FixL
VRAILNVISFLQWTFIEPPPFIQDVALRHRSRLLNLFLFPMILVFTGVDGFFLFSEPGYSPPWYGYIFLVGSYLLNRTRLYRFASFTILVMFPVVIFANIVWGQSQTPQNTLYYLIPGLILAGILLSVRMLVVFTLIEMTVVFSMLRAAPSLFPSFGAIVGPLSALVISAVLVLVSMWFRDRVEKDRQTELRDSEERLRLALDAAKMGTWNWNIETGAVSWSDGIEPMFGMEPGSFDEKYETYLSLIHPEDRAEVQDAISRALQSREGEDYYVEHRSIVNGEIRWLEARGRVHRDGGGEPIGMIGTVVDITDRKRAEQTLRERDERFRKVFHVSPVAMSITTLKEGILIEANDAYWKMTGYKPDEAIGRTTLDLGIWHRQEERERFATKLRERGSLHNPSYEFVNERGETRITVAFYELIESGSELAILSMFYDITGQVNAQKAQEQSEARVRALLDAIPDMIFEFDREGTILQFMPSSTLQPLRPPEEFLGRNISEVMPPMVADQTMFAIQRALESGLMQAFEYQLPEFDQQSYYEATVIRNDDRTVIAMVRDVTARKWAATERDRLIDELERKNAELEQFTYTVSHDLKSPLITIKGFLGLVREDVETGDRERLEKDIQRIGGAAEKMQALLGDLLELSRVGRLINTPESVSFNDLVHETIELLHGRIVQNGIQVQVEDDLPFVNVDRRRVIEVLQNLIENAAKFMEDQPNPRISIGQAGERDGMSVLFVQDNGMGIAPEFHDRIFGLFNKLDARTEGTGIGLALVKRIIEFHGGRIWVESEPEEGSTFFFTLPRGEEDQD